MRRITRNLLRMSVFVGVGLVATWVSGCGSKDVAQFSGRAPELRPEVYFQGQSDGWGVMQDRFGTLLRQFRIEATGVWNPTDGTLSLTETYRFDDGQVDRLEWTLRPVGDERYTATEPRVEGTARGKRAGNAFHWTYVRRVPQSDGSEKSLSFDDWFWLQDDGMLIARASVRRFGIELATLSVFYRKADDAAASFPTP